MDKKDELLTRRTLANDGLNQMWDVISDAQRLISEGNLPDERPLAAPAPDFTPLVESLFPEPLLHASEDVQRCSLEQLQQMVENCTSCDLCNVRQHTVFGEGPMQPLVMVIGEGPGGDEDASGRPFVGRAGQYLDAWLTSIGLDRKRDVYFANVVKCHPPENRDPAPAEMRSCMPYLKRQIELVQPRSILCLGRIAAQAMLASDEGVGKLRGRFHAYGAIPLVVTYHPAGVLRYPDQYRRPVWEDLKKLAKYLSLTVPGRS